MKSLLLLDYNYHPITRHNKTTPKSDLRINRCKLTPRALDHQDQPTSTPTAVRHNRNIMKAAMTIPTTNTRKSTKSTESNINQHHQHPITYTQPPNYINIYTTTPPHLIDVRYISNFRGMNGPMRLHRLHDPLSSLSTSIIAPVLPGISN